MTYTDIGSICEALDDISDDVSIHKIGGNRMKVYFQDNLRSDVVDILKKCNCSVTRESDRDYDTVMILEMGREYSDSI